MGEMISVDTRVDSHIPVDVEEKTSKELAARGLSISSFIHMTLSSIANDGLSKYWGIPSTGTMSLINEIADDSSKYKLRGASSHNELKGLLDE